MNNLSKIIQFISDHKDDLDAAIRLAASRYYDDHKDTLNFHFDINECNNESCKISTNDLCYDRPGIGFSYSLWYHGRRVNTFLKFFARVLYESTEPRIDLLDLGAGTGAVQWAVGLCYTALKRHNLIPPDIRVINIDTSPFMLEYSNKYLWPAFLRYFPEAEKIRYEFSINSWSNTERSYFSNSWLAASYLFDHAENRQEISNDFVLLTRRLNPKKILLLTANLPDKRMYLNNVIKSLTGEGYIKEDVDTGMVFSGIMPKTHELRQYIHRNSDIHFPRTPSWTDNSLYGTVLSRKGTRSNFIMFEDPVDYISVYKPPFIVRREIKLNPKQTEAAQNDRRPGIIVGPAGCGKSVVMTERIKNIVTDYNYLPSLHILVTTFNKQLAKTLSEWLEDLLDKKRFTTATDRGIFDFYFENSRKPNIRLMHFDILPTRIGRLRGNIIYEDQQEEIISTIVTDMLKEDPELSKNAFLLNPRFLLEEYHRVKYGLRVKNWDDYLIVPRKGRKKALQESGRIVVAKILSRFEKVLSQNQHSTFTNMRKAFLSILDKENTIEKFDFIFVDEFQDCTQADYAIFYGLLKDSNNLIIAGDYAQAVHIGKSADSPRDEEKNGERMKNFKWHRLEGSYRLPYRISECIKPISAMIKCQDHEDADIISPHKASPPGARPIVIHADTIEKLASGIIDIVDAYKLFDIDSKNEHAITILEKDEDLELILNQIRPKISKADTILRLKGLEKKCILWSARIDIDNEDEINNFVYTILTRTSSILIIALLADQTPDYYIDILKNLRKDRLIFWDKITKEKFSTL